MVSSTQILGALLPAIRWHGLAVAAALSLGLTLGLVAGCGQRGPLFLPVLPKALNTAPAPVVAPLPAASAPR